MSEIPLLTYFSIVQMPSGAKFPNGGTLYASNIRRRLGQEGIPFIYVLLDAAGDTGCGAKGYRQTGENAYAIGIGKRERQGSIKRFAVKRILKCPFPYEVEASGHGGRVAGAVRRIMEERASGALVTDYLYGCAYLSGFTEMTGVGKYVISCNNEVEFFCDIVGLRRRRVAIRDRIAMMRMAAFERRIYESCDKVIFISPYDKPGYLADDKVGVITCYLDPQPESWKYVAGKNVYFIGNHSHYPNRLAVEYIIGRLAPALLRADPAIRIDILGARAGDFGDDVPPNVRFMGIGTPENAKRLFLTGNLLVCPVENKFGQKFKVAEAVSYGSPFFASRETMLGYPYLSSLPSFAMDDPDGCASAIARLLGDADALNSLSAKIKRLGGEFIVTQRDVWRRTLFGDGKSGGIRSSGSVPPG